MLRCKNRGSWVPSSQTEAVVKSFSSRGMGKGVGLEVLVDPCSFFSHSTLSVRDLSQPMNNIILEQ